jgi:hypothetical protein
MVFDSLATFTEVNNIDHQNTEQQDKQVVTTYNKARICQYKAKRHWKPD